MARTMVPMTSLTIVLDDEAAAQLRRRAEREGVTPAVLAARLVEKMAASPDPFDFVGSFESDVLGARDTDAFLRERGFGAS
jgi:hypothetical protein